MNSERITQFTEEIGELKLRGAKADRERWMLILGSLGLLLGVALAVYGGMQASGTTNAADQWAYLATGTFLGLALTVAGAALFVRYSLARFMRFWLVRIVHEQRSETDRMIEALERIEARLGPVREDA